jgi:putative flippase GtrA
MIGERLLEKQVVRFGVSGALATGVHVAVAVALISRLHVLPPVANSVAFACATLWSYLLNTLWSFSSSLAVATLGRFAVVSLGGVMLTGLVSRGMQFVSDSPWLGIAVVVCVVPPLTYVAHRHWTYRSAVCAAPLGTPQ